MTDFYCVDSKTSYCPCHLVETKSCPVCSILRGEDYCDCHWQGICIYQEFLWRNKKINKRKSLVFDIVDKKYIRDNLITIKLKVNKPGILLSCNQPGVYTFLKGYNLPDFYNTPLSVMDVDNKNNTILFTIGVIGPKTKALANAKTITFKGPYFNGLFGLKHINSSFKKRWLIIGKGIGQIPLILLIKKLNKNKNKLNVFLDPGLLKINIVQDKLSQMGVPIQKIDLDSPKDEKTIEDFIIYDSVDYICSVGSDLQHKKIQYLIDKSAKRIPLIISNNQKLCCGEGICGSCKVIHQGKAINMCKTQFDSKKILGGFNNA